MLNSIIAKNLIKEHMPVVGSDDSELAVVDHLEGTDTIKLARDNDGQHHYIPLTWVSAVDDKVHIDRTSDQAVQEWSETPADATRNANGYTRNASARGGNGNSATHHVNSVDATIGQPIVARVMARKHELEAVLDATPQEDKRARSDLDLALSSIDELLTGDLKHVASTVAVEMNLWLERNKHLGERAVPAAPAPASTSAVPRVNLVDISERETGPVNVQPGSDETNK